MINAFIIKLTSKKFIGWLGACLFLYLGRISENTWIIVTLCYMGAETINNVVDKFNKK